MQVPAASQLGGCMVWLGWLRGVGREMGKWDPTFPVGIRLRRGCLSLIFFMAKEAKIGELQEADVVKIGEEKPICN